MPVLWPGSNFLLFLPFLLSFSLASSRIWSEMNFLSPVPRNTTNENPKLPGLTAERDFHQSDLLRRRELETYSASF
jgi:hypothetical protein